LCGFKLLILLVDSFPDVVNVITSNSTVVKQRKNYIDASFITVVIYKKVVLALTGFKTCLLLFSRFLELVYFSPNPVNVMFDNFLQQMEIDALEQLISEDVKVQGQISCVMVSELASWSSESSPELLPESSSELLSESLPEEIRSTSTTLLPGSSLEESALTSMRADRFFLHVEEKTMPLHGGRRWSLPIWPLRTCTASSPGPTKNRPLAWSAVEDARWRHAGTAPLRHCVTEPHTLGGGGGQHRGKRTETWSWSLLLAEPPPRVAGHTCDGDEEEDRRRKARWSVY
jgi:hypothetical protein